MTTLILDVTPNYATMRASFLKDFHGHANNLIKRTERRIVGQGAGTIALKDLHSLWAAMTIALECSTTLDEIVEMRTVIANMLTKIDELSRLEQSAGDDD